MKPNIWIRQMRWAITYGMWVATKRERKRITKIIKEYAPHLTTIGLMDRIERGEK